MTYDKVKQYRTRKESQCGSRLAQGIWFDNRGCRRVFIPVWDIEAAGLSLCEGGGVCRQKHTCTGSENCLHGQTIPKSYPGAEGICPTQGTNAKRSSHTSLGDFYLQRSEAWLSRGKEFEKLSLNTVLTDYQHAKSVKHTRFLCLTKLGVRTPEEQ